MKHSYYLFVVFVLLGGQRAAAQSAKEQVEARAIYQQANLAASGRALRLLLTQEPTGFMGQENFQFGVLRTYDGRSRPVSKATAICTLKRG